MAESKRDAIRRLLRGAQRAAEQEDWYSVAQYLHEALKLLQEQPA